jgi:prepilin-type N-terminal cleavage/methylation domain-containing protein
VTTGTPVRYRSGHGGALRAERGVTLIEILVVLALMATLMGLGISMFTNLGKQGVFTATIGRVLSTVNRVRNSSMTHPAALQINAGDPDRGQENSVKGIEFVPMFQTQCEPPPEGTTELQAALDRTGTIPPGATFRDGVIGKAIFLEAGGAIDCGDHAAYDATEGVSIDLWIYPTTNAGGTLVRRGESLGLYLVKGATGLGVRFELGFAAGQAATAAAAVAKGAALDAQSAIVETRRFEARDLGIPLNKWTRIVASYDRTNVVISVDYGRGPVEKLRQPERNPLSPARKTRLYVGGGGADGSSFRGGIDDLRIEGVLGEGSEPFAPQVRVTGKTKRIHFLGGKLDPAWHPANETITIEYGKRKRVIEIGLEGNIVSK